MIFVKVEWGKIRVGAAVLETPMVKDNLELLKSLSNQCSKLLWVVGL